jgi:hypothetical protein
MRTFAKSVLLLLLLTAKAAGQDHLLPSTIDC